MSVISKTNRPNRVKLFPRHAVAEPLVQGLGVDGDDLDSVRAFAISLCRTRNAWSVANARANRPYLIKRHEAEAELRRALAALEREGGKNA